MMKNYFESSKEQVKNLVLRDFLFLSFLTTLGVLVFSFLQLDSLILLLFSIFAFAICTLYVLKKTKVIPKQFFVFYYLSSFLLGQCIGVISSTLGQQFFTLIIGFLISLFASIFFLFLISFFLKVDKIDTHSFRLYASILFFIVCFISSFLFFNFAFLNSFSLWNSFVSSSFFSLVSLTFCSKFFEVIRKINVGFFSKEHSLSFAFSIFHAFVLLFLYFFAHKKTTK